MNQKSLIKVLIGVVVVLGVVLALETIDSQRISKRWQDQLSTERKKSRKIVDSLEKIIKLDSLSLIKRVDSITQVKDKLQKDYDKLTKEQNQIKADIIDYLSASDSIRFAKFKQLITEMD